MNNVEVFNGSMKDESDVFVIVLPNGTSWVQRKYLTKASETPLSVMEMALIGVCNELVELKSKVVKPNDIDVVKPNDIDVVKQKFVDYIKRNISVKDIPAYVKYIALDLSGYIYGYKFKPILGYGQWSESQQPLDKLVKLKVVDTYLIDNWKNCIVDISKVV